MDLRKVHTIIFDMDGVVTRERVYWQAAALTVLETMTSEQFFGREISAVFLRPVYQLLTDAEFLLPESFIAAVKGRSINTNWDLAFFAIGLQLIDWLATAPGFKPTSGSLEDLRAARPLVPPVRPLRGTQHLLDELLLDHPSLSGFQYIDALHASLVQRTGIEFPLFDRTGPLWKLTMDLFQEWTLGSNRWVAQGNERVSCFFKWGLIENEDPVVPLDDLHKLFDWLSFRYTMGIATGRPYEEIMLPLRKWGLLQYFSPDRIATHRNAEVAEAFMAERGEKLSLSKPHPFLFLASVFPADPPLALLRKKFPIEGREHFLVVGDAVSDIAIARTLGCPSVAVLTGVRGDDAQARLRAAGPTVVLDSVLDLRQTLGIIHGR